MQHQAKMIVLSNFDSWMLCAIIDYSCPEVPNQTECLLSQSQSRTPCGIANPYIVKFDIVKFKSDLDVHVQQILVIRSCHQVLKPLEDFALAKSKASDQSHQHVKILLPRARKILELDLISKSIRQAK